MCLLDGCHRNMNLRVKGQRGFDDAKGRLGKNDDADDEGDVTKVFQSVLLLAC